MTIDTSAKTYIRSPLSPPIMNPLNSSLPSPTSGNADPNDYFGLGIAVSRDGTPQAGDGSPLSPSASRHRRPRDDTSSPTTDRRTSRPKDKREKDKKTMLSMALEKANTAVLLDNAHNLAGALDAYGDACGLLEQVMDRTGSMEDREKLEAIRNTYATRIEELTILQQPSSGESSEKQLPPRPSSNESDVAPAATIPQIEAPSRIPPLFTNTLPVNTKTNGPFLAAPAVGGDARDRSSFLSDAIREVEGGAEGGFLGPLWERERSRSPLSTTNLTPNRSNDKLNSPDAPLPLEPNRSSSPRLSPRDGYAELPADTTPKPIVSILHAEPASWLNTIDESDSDQSRVAKYDGKGSNARYGQNQPETNNEFDAVFNEAIEAAYDDNYDEDQRMMDDLAKDYMDNTFKVDAHRKSSLPQPSNHNTPRLRNTWGSATIGDIQGGSKTLSMLSDSSGLRGLGTQTNDQRASTSTNGTSESGLRSRDNTEKGSISQDANQDTMSRKRSSDPSVKPLTIETAIIPSRRRAPSTASRKTEYSVRSIDVAPWEARDRTAEVTPWELEDKLAEVTPWDLQGSVTDKFGKTGSLKRLDKEPASATSDSGSSALGDVSSPRARKVRNQKSSLSLTEQSAASTPTMAGEKPYNSGGFGQTFSRRNESSGHVSQRSITGTSTAASSMTPVIPPVPETAQQGGVYLFDTTLGRSIEQPMSSSPRPSKDPSIPNQFEPCPDSPLLRPFWMLRIISNAAIHPRGGYLTSRLFMPHEAWQTRSAKLKNLEDKISACDTLTTALVRLEGVDTYDADAVLAQLQLFEEIMERVQATLNKKLGSEVGANNAISSFKESDKASSTGETATETTSASKDSAKGKGFSWRKLRGKASSISGPTGGGGEMVTMQTVPMTSFNGLEKKFNHRKQALSEAIFSGVHGNYMASIAKLCEAAQTLG